jgi:hypothetical protein
MDLMQPKNKQEIIRGKQSALNIAKMIKRAIIESSGGANKIAPQFKGSSPYMTAFKVYDFTRKNIPYHKEGENLQTAKTIQRILSDTKNGIGHDCKHYTIFACSMLRALGIPCEMRLISQNFYNAEPTHIYCVASIGGKEVIVDACMKNFNNEASYKYKYNLKIK